MRFNIQDTLIGKVRASHLYYSWKKLQRLLSPQARHLTKPQFGSSASLLQGTQPQRYATQGECFYGKGVSKDSSKFSNITMQ